MIDKLRQTFVAEWLDANNDKNQCDGISESAWDTEWEVFEACAEARVDLLKQLAKAANFPLPTIFEPTEQPEW